jgi:hypothetical protein
LGLLSRSGLRAGTKCPPAQTLHRSHLSWLVTGPGLLSRFRCPGCTAGTNASYGPGQLARSPLVELDEVVVHVCSSRCQDAGVEPVPPPPVGQVPIRNRVQPPRHDVETTGMLQLQLTGVGLCLRA